MVAHQYIHPFFHDLPDMIGIIMNMIDNFLNPIGKRPNPGCGLHKRIVNFLKRNVEFITLSDGVPNLIGNSASRIGNIGMITTNILEIIQFQALEWAKQ